MDLASLHMTAVCSAGLVPASVGSMPLLHLLLDGRSCVLLAALIAVRMLNTDLPKNLLED